MPNQELEAEKMGKKQKELPGMPVNSELKDLCESFIAYLPPRKSLTSRCSRSRQARAMTFFISASVAAPE